MKTQKNILIIFLLLLSNIVLAQPFTLDEDLKPIELKLEPNSKYEGSKYVETTSFINKNDITYYYITGHDIYQFVDIFIFANKGNPDLVASVVFNTWDNIEETQQTKSSKDGIINFKLRSYQDIGFTVKSLDTDNVSYSIIVNASPPVMAHLGSPFVKTTSENAALNDANKHSDAGSNDKNIWAYVIIGLLLLIVGLLARKLLGKKKALSVILFMALTSLSTESFGQTLPLENARRDNEETETNRRMAELDLEKTRRGQIKDHLDKFNKAFDTADAIKKYLEQYKNLGNCLNSTPPPGQPTIPSFCVDEMNSCASCFLSARGEFNEARYKLDKLQTIYDCTKAYTDAAISFGDNVSSYHGVVGLVWQSKRREVEKSIVSLNKAYDQKRVELLGKLNTALMKLDACEQEHGITDWYDRFGVMFYNFSEMRYHR